jgi:hypothetical protein
MRDEVLRAATLTVIAFWELTANSILPDLPQINKKKYL